MAIGMTLNGVNSSTYDSMKLVLKLVGLIEKEINESYKSIIELLFHLDPKINFNISNII